MLSCSSSGTRFHLPGGALQCIPLRHVAARRAEPALVLPLEIRLVRPGQAPDKVPAADEAQDEAAAYARAAPCDDEVQGADASVVEAWDGIVGQDSRSLALLLG